MPLFLFLYYKKENKEKNILTLSGEIQEFGQQSKKENGSKQVHISLEITLKSLKNTIKIYRNQNL